MNIKPENSMERKNDPPLCLDEDIRELYEHAPCGYLLIQEDGLIVTANQTFLFWTDCKPEALIRKCRFQDFLTLPSKIYYETHFAPLLKMQGNVREVAFDLEVPNRPAQSVLVTSVLREYTNQQLKLYRTMVFDVTARRHYERQLLQQKRKLEQLNNEKNELLGMAAHELRSPLGVISSYSEFLEEEAGPLLSQEHNDFLSLIRSTSTYMLHLINDMLDVSRIEAGKLHLDLQLTDMHLLVEKTMNLNQRLADRKQIRTLFDSCRKRPLIRIDANKISQVLENLLINAIKFSPPKTQVSVKLNFDDAHVCLSVIDQGVGIPAEELQHIFKPFRRGQVKSTSGEPSTGLGLAIVRRIVEGHGGTVQVHSVKNQGTEFSIQLPLITD